MADVSLPRSGTAVAPFQVRVAPLVASPADARHAFAAWLAAAGIANGPLGDALVVLSELVTNGVMHGGPDDILVGAETNDRCLSIQVVTAPAPPSAHAFLRPSDPGGTGRGLAIVGALCERVVTAHDASGRRTVNCSIMLG
jgi:serine/threonine-protein kinase RsbW